MVKAPQFQQGPAHCRNLVAAEQEYGLAGKARSTIAEGAGDGKGVVFLGRVRRDLQIRIGEIAIGEAMTEGKQGRIPDVDIFAGVMVVGIGGPARRMLTEKD